MLLARSNLPPEHGSGKKRLLSPAALLVYFRTRLAADAYAPPDPMAVTIRDPSPYDVAAASVRSAVSGGIVRATGVTAGYVAHLNASASGSAARKDLEVTKPRRAVCQEQQDGREGHERGAGPWRVGGWIKLGKGHHRFESASSGRVSDSSSADFSG